MQEKLSIGIIRSNEKIIRFLLISLPLLAIALWMALKESSTSFDVFLGWFGVAYFGFGIVLRTTLLFNKKVQVKINEEGILDIRLKVDRIKWEQIEGAKLYKGFRQTYVSLELETGTDLSLNKTNIFLNTALGAGKVNLNMSQLDFEPELLVNIINGLCQLSLEERIELLEKIK